jgi:hypothetical protein
MVRVLLCVQDRKDREEAREGRAFSFNFFFFFFLKKNVQAQLGATTQRPPMPFLFFPLPLPLFSHLLFFASTRQMLQCLF